MTEILVTGLGMVGAFGEGYEPAWAAVGRGEAARLREAGTALDSRIERRLGHFMSPEQRQAMALKTGDSGSSDYAIAAARHALADAGLDAPLPGTGAAMGSGMGDSQPWFENRRGDTKGSDRLYCTADRVGEVLDLDGPILEIATACAASGYAIAASAALLRSGEAQAMLCGGADSLNVHALAAFNRLGALDAEACRPFDIRRGGTLFGEGAALCLLEREDAFRARGGSRAYARLSGIGMSCDGVHPTAPSEDGLQIERAIRAALDEAGLGPDAIDLLFPHATGTPLNDQVESAVLARVFGAAENQPWSVPLKAFIGHSGGAAAAFSTVFAILSLVRQTVLPSPPTVADPACPIRLAFHGAIEAPGLRAALVNAYAFGGSNISLVFEKYPEAS